MRNLNELREEAIVLEKVLSGDTHHHNNIAWLPVRDYMETNEPPKTTGMDTAFDSL